MLHHGQPPLARVRVADLTHDWAGPHATRLLADFGAEVIRVEYSRRMDLIRGGRTAGQAYNHHPRWLEMNRNKLSMTLDLNTSGDREALKALVKISDVVVESSRVGVLAHLGLGYEELSKIKPEIIMVSMSAFGQTGPEASYSGFGGSLEPLSGVQALTAYHKTGKPVRLRELDVLNGIMGACAIMTALIDRQRTGRGQWVDLSQLEAPIHGLIGEHLLEYAVNGTQTLPLGNRHARYAPHGCYRCQGDDKWVVIAVRSDEEWERFAEVLGRPELKQDARFAKRADRAQNHDELDRLIEAWTILHTPDEAMHLLQQAGIAAGAVLNVAELSRDPHLQARGFFQRVQDGSGRLFPGMPFQLSEGKGEVRRCGPQVGEHNEDVLCELLGRSKAELEPLTEDKIGTAYDME